LPYIINILPVISPLKDVVLQAMGTKSKTDKHLKAKSNLREKLSFPAF